MVVAHSFQEVFDASSKTTALSLPQHKESVFRLEFRRCKDNKTQFNGSEPPLPFAASEVVNTSIVDWRRLTANDKECKAVYEVSFEFKSSNFCYKPGDTIGIIPKNNKCEVDFLITHLNISDVADSWYSLGIDGNQTCAKAKVPAHIPVSSTIRHVLTHCVDFRTVVKKLFLLALSRYTKDEVERKVLEYLCSKEGSAAYTMHILNSNICLLDILANFKSCKPSIETLLQYLPRLLPRPYSIVNSPLQDPNVLKICFSVMDIGNNRKGLTTGWLENMMLKQNYSLEHAFENLSVKVKGTVQHVRIYLRKNMNSFELQEKSNTPLILIGPGTGVAPYIGFLEHIEYLRKVGSQELCDIWLFFGCRNPNLDFIYQEELNGFLERKVLSHLKTAFSRCNDCENKYVQDAIMKNGKEIVQMIKDGSRIFVCGDGKSMAAQLKVVIVNCLVKYGDKSVDEAEELVRDLQKNKLYITDIWN